MEVQLYWPSESSCRFSSSLK